MNPMNVIVCVKQIPDPALPGSLDPATKALKRDGCGGENEAHDDRGIP